MVTLRKLKPTIQVLNKNLAREWVTNSKFVQWEIGDGTMIKDWDDCWVQVGLRLHSVVSNPDLFTANVVLIDMVDINDNWNWRVFKENLRGLFVYQIHVIALPLKNS